MDKTAGGAECFSFKHHYMTGAMDSGVLAALFDAMSKKSAVTVSNLGRKSREARKNRIIPLRIFISAQNGRQHLIAYAPAFNAIKSFRVDYLSDVKLEEPSPRFDELRARLDEMQEKAWGVMLGGIGKEAETERVEFTIRVCRGEEYIANRLEREKRVGKVEKTGEFTYRFTADVYDSAELVPWIRTFICRIEEIKFSNAEVEKHFKSDMEEMYRMYGIDGEAET